MWAIMNKNLKRCMILGSVISSFLSSPVLADENEESLEQVMEATIFEDRFSPRSIDKIEFYPSHDLVILGNGENVAVVDAVSLEEKINLRRYEGYLGASISPDGKYLVVEGIRTEVYDIETKEKIFESYGSAISNVSFSPDSKVLVRSDLNHAQGTINNWRVITAWSLPDLRELTYQHACESAKISFSADSKLMEISCTRSGNTVFSLTDGEPLPSADFEPSERQVKRLPFTLEKSFESWSLVDRESGETLLSKEGNIDESRYVYSDETKMFICRVDDELRLYSLETKKKVESFTREKYGNFASGANFSPDGQLIYLGFESGHLGVYRTP